ncbi:aldo/keto reductase [Aurantimonas sp. VKM B-3413]|uniref:aldo/keto reductase n=1 Tax=Aurantimonas sp. VKM B-3413 TaxID=2779401 RepID=UPI001E4F3E41|nr:aldo/keto reductase [Aurantimonas sp. VKM B-3413]MCB8840783.1 aldo/keto reductase [Aurantimonas sp. VKM B-3413]
MTTLPRMPLFPGGPAVSRLCLGSMMFGDQTDEAGSRAILERFLSSGGNFVDTADAYAGQESEKILGRQLRDAPDDLFLATKVGNPVSGVQGSGGLSAEWIARAAQMSRERLQRETIDLYYLHLDDEVTPLEEIVAALGGLIETGAIRHWGFSNFRAWKIAEMIRIADALGIPRPVVAQPYYHILNRVVEAEYLPACRHFGIGVVPYSPLGRGILTGKYRNGAPEGSRADRGDKRMLEVEFVPQTVSLANEVADYADRSGRPPAGLAIRWVLANEGIPSVLIGPKTLDQLEGYLKAIETPYGPEDEAFLSGLCAPGQLPVAGHADPRYPYRGRRPQV